MKTAYTNCTLLSGHEDMVPQSGMTVVVEDERILSVLKDEEFDGAADKTVNLGGMYLMPGLVNLHIHLPAGGKPKKKETDPRVLVKILMSNPITRFAAQKMCEGFAKMQLLSGVTTVRTVGGVRSIDTTIRDRINSKKMVGPRILAANMAVSVPEGHMAGSLAYEAVSAEHARVLVQLIAKDKPDLIKLMITGGVLDAKVPGEPGVLRMPPEYVKAACDEAHKLGLMVAAHVESSEGVKVALENGVDTIEHGAALDDYLIELFKKTGAKLVTTLSPALPYALFDRSVSGCTETAQLNGQVVFDGIISCAKDALANGITVGLGTDTGCPYITHYDMWRELNYFVKYCGVTPVFALFTATLQNARIAGVDGETGSIDEGKCADFIVCATNPLEDLTALRQLEMVCARGSVIEKPVIKKYENVETELDEWL